MLRTVSVRLVPWLSFCALLVCSGGCNSQDPTPQKTASGKSASDGSGEQAKSRAPSTPKPAEPVVLTREQLKQPALLMVKGPDGSLKETWIEAQDAADTGYTLVDFGNQWTPFLFTIQKDEQGQSLPNRYRRVFQGLANDDLDSDGRPLEDGDSNFLELYGIFPTMGVVQSRFLLDETRTCVDAEGQAAMQAADTVPYATAWKTRRNNKRQEKLGRQLEGKRKSAKVDTFAALAEKKPSLKKKIQGYEKWARRRAALKAAEERLSCEGFLDLSGKGSTRKRHSRGVYDGAIRKSLRKYQQKHMIYEGHTLRPRTLKSLSRSTLDNDYEAFTRVFRERVMAAAGVIEDGSTHGEKSSPTYMTANGEKLPMPNLAEQYTESGLAQLGLESTEAVLAFFKRHPAEHFENLKVAVKLKAPPPYYTSMMDLSLEIDRGDVFYDPPFDDDDKWRHQRRRRFPKLTLYVKYGEQRLPLIRWRTTIGGWRAEQAPNGYEYYKYKASDTGQRVMRKIISGPVWIAPESTPVRSLVQSKKVEGRYQGMVNYDELGPGYTSAYGVVAGYFVIPGNEEKGKPDVDRGIRAHGSSNYLSIYSNSGYSHGCHRLPNYLAVRLYDFVLQHRTIKVHGDDKMDFHRQFLWKKHVYEMRIPSRGYEFELDPPMPVNVLEGRIRGTLQDPVEGFVQKPGIRYPATTGLEEEGEDLLESASEGQVDAVTGASQRAAMKRAARQVKEKM